MAGLRRYPYFVIINSFIIFDNLVERQKWHLQPNFEYAGVFDSQDIVICILENLDWGNYP